MLHGFGPADVAPIKIKPSSPAPPAVAMRLPSESGVMQPLGVNGALFLGNLAIADPLAVELDRHVGFGGGELDGARVRVGAVRVISPSPVIADGLVQVTFQVAFGPSTLKSEFVHFCRSSAGAGGSFHSLGAQTLSVCEGRFMGIPSIDILEVTSQRSPFSLTAAGCASAARRGIEIRRRSVAAAARRRRDREVMRSPPILEKSRFPADRVQNRPTCCHRIGV